LAHAPDRTTAPSICGSGPQSLSTNYLATVGPRIGIAADRNFTYIAGGAAPAPGGVALYLAAKRPARPSPQAVSAHSGHNRSAKDVGGIARFHVANNQDWSPYLACQLHCSSQINLHPIQRKWLVPKSSVPWSHKVQGECLVVIPPQT
jgi:hypothetical protein